MGFCFDCAKYCLYLFNVVFALSGLALIIVGGIALYRVDGWGNLIEGSANIKSPQIVVIVVGVLTFFVATVGCCGVIRSNKFMLLSYAILLILIFLVELIIGIYALVNFNQIKDTVIKDLDKEFGGISRDTEARKGFDALEVKLECCGMNGTSDYARINLPVPDSCCRQYEKKCAGKNQFWEKGCKDVLGDALSDLGKLVGGCALGLSLLEIIGVILALKSVF